MDWRKKLALATSAFMAMPAASVANTCTGESAAHRRIRVRRVSVPARIVPGEDSIRVNVRVPTLKKMYPPESTACNTYSVEASLVDQNGFTSVPIKRADIGAGQGTTLTFEWDPETDSDIPAPATVIAKVEVTPTDLTECATVEPVTSFVLVEDSNRTFLPSRDLNPILLLPDELGGPTPIKKP